LILRFDSSLDAPNLGTGAFRAKNPLIEKNLDEQGAPISLKRKIRQPKGWTEWTQGFQYGERCYNLMRLEIQIS
jgi:hypothetical protein